MPPAAELAVLIAVFFITSVVGVVTGSNSLIAVPAMFQAGIDARTAVATNMFALVFMAAGGTIPFLRQGKVDVVRSAPLIVLTLIGSAIGAMIVGAISDSSMKMVVTVAMFAIVGFTLIRPNAVAEDAGASRGSMIIAFVLTFLLGIYGGLFSGGYVTVLTATLVAFSGMSYTSAVANTKLINVFSSLIATVVFMWQGLVDYRLGVILGVTMFAGAYVGAHFASRLDEVWLRRIFLGTVALLAVKTLYDLVA